MAKKTDKKAKVENRRTLLKGEGVNQHTLYGKFSVKDNGDNGDFAEISVLEKSELRHEKPDCSFGEHFTIEVEKGEWVTGKQVEYNPFKMEISRIWD